MAASLKGIDPELKNYLKIHRLPDVYEALLTGLAVMCPDDPYQFIVDKLRYLQEEGKDEMEWDSFVDEDMRPKQKLLTESGLNYIFNFDANLEPTAEMYEKAYNHYNRKLKMEGFGSWMMLHLQKKRKNSIEQHNDEMADTHYRHRIYRIHLNQWKNWLRYRKGRQQVAFNKIEHVYLVTIGRILFEAWHSVTLDAKRTREYFERLERGEHMDDDDVFGRGSGEARDDISMLPLRVAVKIFQNIDVTDIARCACVCRSWKVITEATALWCRLDLTKVRYSVEDKTASRLLAKCRPYLVNLNLQSCDKIGMRGFLSIRECKNLQDLNLSECPLLTDEALKYITNGCKILLYLNISHTAISDGGMRAIASECNNLQYLSVAFCRKFTDKGIFYLANGKCSEKIVHIDLSGCNQITPEGFAMVGGCLLNLKSLHVNELTSLDDVSLRAALQDVKTLQEVTLLDSTGVTDESLIKLAYNKNLLVVKIDSNPYVSDATFKYIAKYCTELHHLYLTDCVKITDATLKALSVCRNLTVVNVADCVRITDTGVRHFVEGPSGPKLKELNLTNCVRVGDLALVNIHKRCYSLAYFSVCFCEHISEAGIELLGQTNSLTSLDISGCNCGDQGLSALGNNVRFKEVILSECVNITDLGLQKFAQQCTEIERLDLSHCQLVTDGAIKNLAFCCRLLTSLNLDGCRLLTDLSVQYLSGVCHYLKFLDISGSLHITDKGLKYLRKGCKRLKTLRMEYSKHITKHGAHKMMKYVEEVHHNNLEIPEYYKYDKPSVTPAASGIVVPEKEEAEAEKETEQEEEQGTVENEAEEEGEENEKE